MTAITEGQYAGEFLISEGPGTRSREIGTVKQLQNLKAGAVIAIQALAASVTVTPDGGNTGNGVVTMGASDLGTAAIVGTYKLECIAAATDGGRFSVTTPGGDALEEALVGVAYANDHLGFTIADGATDWAVGDKVSLIVGAGDKKIVELAPTANDGTQIAAGILFDNVDASATGTNADTAATYIARDAEVNAGELQWPTGITSDQKTTATNQLAVQGILSRR